MNQQKIRVLLVEEDEEDYLFARDLFTILPGWEVRLDWAPTRQAALERVGKESYDICIVDYRPGGEYGIDLMRRLIENGFGGPVVVTTGKGTREIDIEAMREGASDYIEKSNLNPDTLERCIRYNIERSRVLNKLKNAQDRLRKLSVKLVDAQERERRLIAQELHDSIGSSLTAIKFALGITLSDIKAENPPAEGISVEKILSMVQETIEETRRISTKLRPSILDDLGLAQTIRWMCRNFGTLHPQIRIRQSIEVEESDVPESLKTVVYRILQEALNNVAKHSDADTVSLSLRRTEQGLVLEVEDNGRGFDMQKVLPGGRPEDSVGLEGMRDRAEFADGSFEIISLKGKGTTVRALWPIFPPAPFR